MKRILLVLSATLSLCGTGAFAQAESPVATATPSPAAAVADAEAASSPQPSAAAASEPAKSAVPAPTWAKVLEGEHASIYVHEGVGVPATVFGHLRTLAPHQVTLLMRSCSGDGVPSVKLEHLRGREGQPREAVAAALEALQGNEDNPAVAEVLDYALVIGLAGPARMTTTLRVYKPESRAEEELTPPQLVDGARIEKAFPALGVPCPKGATTVEQALSMRAVLDARFKRNAAGRVVRQFEADGAAAVAAFNEVSEVLAAVQLPAHILGLRQQVDGQPHVAQASKWPLPNAKELTLVLEQKSGQWTLRAQ